MIHFYSSTYLETTSQFQKTSKQNRSILKRFDVFSLGLVFLEAGLLESVQSIYDVNKGDFSNEKLNEFLRKFNLIYDENSVISEYLTHMLNPNYLERMDFVELKSSLPSWYQLKIAIDLKKTDFYNNQDDSMNANTPILQELNTEEKNLKNTFKVELGKIDNKSLHNRPSNLRENDFEYPVDKFVPEVPRDKDENEIRMDRAITFKTTNEPVVNIENAVQGSYFYETSKNGQPMTQYQEYLKGFADQQTQNFESFKNMDGNETAKNNPDILFSNLNVGSIVNENPYNLMTHESKELNELTENIGNNIFNEIGGQVGFNKNPVSDQIQMYLNTDQGNYISDFQKHETIGQKAPDRGFSHYDTESIISPYKMKIGDNYNNESGIQDVPFLSQINQSTDRANGVLESQPFEKLRNESNNQMKKPVKHNDFRSGVSEIKESIPLISGNSTKMTLSNYLKTMKQ